MNLQTKLSIIRAHIDAYIVLPHGLKYTLQYLYNLFKLYAYNNILWIQSKISFDYYTKGPVLNLTCKPESNE